MLQAFSSLQLLHLAGLKTEFSLYVSTLNKEKYLMAIQSGPKCERSHGWSCEGKLKRLHSFVSEDITCLAEFVPSDSRKITIFFSFIVAFRAWMYQSWCFTKSSLPFRRSSCGNIFSKCLRKVGGSGWTSDYFLKTLLIFSFSASVSPVG